jgi:pimeloyl-ACP methyl ester carboxylesterase
MARVAANGIEIEYEDFGATDAPPVLLIMGLGAQLVRWPMPLVEQLVARGYRVIRYDNRDVGLSTKLDDAGTPNIVVMAAAKFFGRKPVAPYTLTDMAADGIGLLDALGIRAAHIMGASMGGMIAQLIAAGWPAHTLSLTSIMSSTGNPSLPFARPRATGVLMRRPRGDDIDSIVAHGVLAAKVIGSPAYPIADADLAERVRAETERGHYPPGFTRQMAAIIADGDRRDRLRTITAPTVVIHGSDDPLVNVAGGRDTAVSIPGAHYVEVPGMGHTLPGALIPVVLDAFETVSKPPLARAA